MKCILAFAFSILLIFSPYHSQSQRMEGNRVQLLACVSDLWYRIEAIAFIMNFIWIKVKMLFFAIIETRLTYTNP